VDDEKLIFFESSVFDIFSVGFTQIPGGDDYKDRNVLSYHVYCGLEPKNILEKYVCKGIDELFFYTRNKAVDRLEIPGFLTEFGALHNDTYHVEEIDSVCNQAESRF